MKIQLDTKAKTIKVEEDVKFGELIAALNKLFPKGEWKSFELKPNTIINNWSSPIIIERTVSYIEPYKPTYPWYAYDTSGDAVNLCSGTFNVEV